MNNSNLNFSVDEDQPEVKTFKEKFDKIATKRVERSKIYARIISLDQSFLQLVMGALNPGLLVLISNIVENKMISKNL